MFLVATVGIMKVNGKISSKVYRSPCIHSSTLIVFLIMQNYIVGVLKGLIHSAHVLHNRKKDLIAELELLKDVYTSNSKPQMLVEKALEES